MKLRERQLCYELRFNERLLEKGGSGTVESFCESGVMYEDHRLEICITYVDCG